MRRDRGRRDLRSGRAGAGSGVVKSGHFDSFSARRRCRALSSVTLLLLLPDFKTLCYQNETVISLLRQTANCRRAADIVVRRQIAM